jgi:hypothetical protein
MPRSIASRAISHRNARLTQNAASMRLGSFSVEVFRDHASFEDAADAPPVDSSPTSPRLRVRESVDVFLECDRHHRTPFFCNIPRAAFILLAVRSRYLGRPVNVTRSM